MLKTVKKIFCLLLVLTISHSVCLFGMFEGLGSWVYSWWDRTEKKDKNDKKNGSTDDGKSMVLLAAAIQKGNLEQIKGLLNNSADLGKKMLMEKFYDKKTVKALVTAVPELINAKESGRTILHKIAEFPFVNSLEIVEFLIAQGADPNLTDAMGRTALICAFEGKVSPDRAFDIAKKLIHLGSNVNFVYKERRPIFYVVALADRDYSGNQLAYQKCCELIKQLVLHGADPRDADERLAVWEKKNLPAKSVLDIRFSGCPEAVRDYLILADDFYRTLKKSDAEDYLPFDAFIKQYLDDVADPEKAEINGADIKALVALRGTENMASQLFNWMSRKNLLEKQKIKPAIQWFYLYLAEQADTFPAKMAWFGRCFTYFGIGGEKSEFEQRVSDSINKLDKKQRLAVWEKKNGLLLQPKLAKKLLIPKKLPSVTFSELSVESEKDPVKKGFRDIYFK